MSRTRYDIESQMTKLESVVSALSPAKTDVLKRKTLPWDAVILLIASLLVGLSVSDVLVEFLKPEPSKVTCFVPTSNNLDRDQYQYVNEFCYHALPYSVNLTIALALQGLLLIALHYVWTLALSNRIHSYFAYVSKMESIPRINKNTGEYTEKNIEIVQYMRRQHKGKLFIVVSYLIKLVIQGLLVTGAIVFNATHFQEFDSTFTCNDSTNNHSLFENVTCSYSKLQYLSILNLVDYILLGISLITLIFGIYWCLLNDVTLAHKEIAEFGYQSGILGTHYINCFSIWKHWRNLINFVPLYRFQWLPIKDDLHFLVFMLSLTNAELGKLFKDVQVFDDIFCMFHKDLELSPSENDEGM